MLFIPLLILTVQKEQLKERTVKREVEVSKITACCWGLRNTHCAASFSSFFNLYQIPSKGWGLQSLITCSCQNSTAESHYFKFYRTRHLLLYLAIFFILLYPKPVIDRDSHKSLCCFFLQIYRTEGRSGKNINQS